MEVLIFEALIRILRSRADDAASEPPIDAREWLALLDPDSLIRTARAEPRERLGELLDHYRRYLTMLARTCLAPDVRAKTAPSDLVQEALLRAYERFDQFRGGSERELAAWLRQILTRCLLDAERRFRTVAARAIEREVPLAEMIDLSSAKMGAIVPADVTSPSMLAQRREFSVIVADALEQLAPDHREVIRLRNIEGRSWPEIAERMGRSRKAVGMLWTRALEKLRPLIQ